jgi:hypothetical protein
MLVSAAVTSQRQTPLNTPVRIRAISTKPALQSAGCRRSILWAQRSAALDQHQTAAIGSARENRLD